MTEEQAKYGDTPPVLTETEQLRYALFMAIHALNTAPRFKVRGLPERFNDSYKVVAECERVFRATDKHR
jgi:hypothetical protein